jgi:hypothetical protein
MAMAELLAAALARAEVDEAQLRRIGADWGRYLLCVRRPPVLT